MRRGPGRALTLAGLLVAAACLTFAVPARAQIWGFVDSAGVVHLAAHQVDARYELYSRAGPVADLSQPVDPATAGAAPPGVLPDQTPSALPPRLAAFFSVSPGYRQAQPLLREAAQAHGVDYELLKALIVAESGFDARAVSPKGAVGLMQVMPATAERWGVSGDARMPVAKKLADPQTNVRTGTRYLRHLMTLFPGRLDLALAAYNAGEGAVQRAGNRIPNFPETQNYVKTVMQLYAWLKPARPAPVPTYETAQQAARDASPEPARAARIRVELPGTVPGRASMPPSLTGVGALGGGRLPVVTLPAPSATNGFPIPQTIQD